MQQMESSKKVKAKCCLFMFYLCCQQFFVETKSASIKELNVAKYLIQRDSVNQKDIFGVSFKQTCNKGSCNYPSCGSLSAEPPGAASSPENFPFSCACQFSSRTFLPEIGKCLTNREAGKTLKGEQTLSAIGCSQYQLLWIDLFLKAFDLTNNGSVTQYVDNLFHTCKVLPKSPVYYDGLEKKWKRICTELFSIRFQKYKGVFLEWKADTNKELSGRIIRLVVTCNYTAVGKQPFKGCLLFKAAGDITYNYVNQSTVQETGCTSTTVPSLVPTESSQQPLSSLTSPSSSLLSPSPSTSSSLSSLSLPSSSSPSSLSPSPSPSSSSTVHVATTEQKSLETTTASLASSSFFPWQSQTTQISDQSKTSSSKIILPSKPETKTTEPASSTESLTVVSETILKPAFSTNVFPVRPSKSSSATNSASSSTTIDGPGNKEARTNGNDNGAVIGAAVGGAVVLGILAVVIIVFCKRRKLWKNKEKEKATKLEVKNPVYGSSDIPLSTTTEKQVTTSSDQDNQPTYQGLIINNGQMNGSAVYSIPEVNYDNYTVYQSLDKKIPETPVYQSLKKGQAVTGKPNPKPKSNATGKPSKRPKLNAEPVYNVLKQPDAEQGAMPEEVYEDPGRDNHGDTPDPLYNVLEGPDAEQNYEAPNVGDPLYNVLEGPETKQEPQEPLYNVLESSDAENNPSGTQAPCDGSKNEPLYNVLEGPDSAGPNKGGVGHAAPNGSTSPDAHDNPAYEQSLELDASYASVHRPGSQRESVYEPLRGMSP